MADNKKQPPVSFDDIIKAGAYLHCAVAPQGSQLMIPTQGRQKRRNEQLAQDIFGKNRRSSAPATGNIKKAPLGGSLASRVGVTKVRLDAD